MNNNDILRRLRYAFDFSNKQATELFSLDPASSAVVSIDEFQALLTKEEDDGFQACNDIQLAAFLDGLIVSRRGLREPAPAPQAVPIQAVPIQAVPIQAVPIQAEPLDFRLSKNDILKKLRIAMNYREQDMLKTLSAGGSELSKAELSALFRNPQHKHYRSCGNQVLRNFIKGLTQELRDQG